MNTAIFGGSFDPVHNGHVRLAENILSAVTDIEKLVIMPTLISPFKQDGAHASGSDRLNMCRLAFEDIPCAEVSGYEISGSGISYTVDTVTHYRSLDPEGRLYLIMGGDSLRSFGKWYRSDDILRMCTIISAARTDDEIAQLDALSEELSKNGSIIALKAKPFEISSTAIRKKILNNEDISCYLPRKVVKYITDHDLYRFPKEDRP